MNTNPTKTATAVNERTAQLIQTYRSIYELESTREVLQTAKDAYCIMTEDDMDERRGFIDVMNRITAIMESIEDK